MRIGKARQPVEGHAAPRAGPAHGLDSANWTILSSGTARREDTTRWLAELYGHTFTKTEEGYQAHGAVTHVIDREGRWRADFHGLRFQQTNLVLFINAPVNETNQSHDHDEPGFWQRLWALFKA